jgi:cytochrome c
MRRIALSVLVLFSFNACSRSPTSNNTAMSQDKVLVFSKTTGFRHDSIPDGIAAVQQLGRDNQFGVDASEDATVFGESNLAQYKVIIFLNTTGDLFNDAQKSALQHYIQSGGGFVSIHSAGDTEHNWVWYGQLVGSFFQSHPAIQSASIQIQDSAHPSTSGLPQMWQRTDEWYNFVSNPRGSVHVLAKIDESTYSGGTMGTDHPIAWCQAFSGGRSWYTAGGHTKESYTEKLFVQHLLGGIQYAMGRATADCTTRN